MAVSSLDFLVSSPLLIWSKSSLYDERVMSDARVGKNMPIAAKFRVGFLGEISCGFECSQKLAHGVCKLVIVIG